MSNDLLRFAFFFLLLFAQKRPYTTLLGNITKVDPGLRMTPSTSKDLEWERKGGVKVPRQMNISYSTSRPNQPPLLLLQRNYLPYYYT